MARKANRKVRIEIRRGKYSETVNGIIVGETTTFYKIQTSKDPSHVELLPKEGRSRYVNYFAKK